MSVRPKAAPDWQCQGTAVLRDVAPGHVPVPIPDEDGNPWWVIDMDARLVNAVEKLARKKGRSFASITHEVGLYAAWQRMKGE